MDKHYDQKPRRKAEFIKLPNTLKMKVGNGGLSEAVLNKAQNLLDKHSVEFKPLAESSLNQLALIVQKCKKTKITKENNELLIQEMIPPALDLKSNGGMFHYPLVTRIANRLVGFLEVINKIDDDVLEIVEAFHTSITAVVLGSIQSDGGKQGDEMVKVLTDACGRYFKKNT